MKDIMIVDINSVNFSELVLLGSKKFPVILVFWSDKNAESLRFVDIWDKLAKQYAGKCILGKVNVDKEKELAIKLGFSQLPLCKLVKNQAFAAVQEVLQDLESCERLLKEHLPEDLSGKKHQQAKAAIQQQDFASAEQLLREAIELDSNKAELHLDLVDMFLKQGKNQEAQDLFQSLPHEIKNSSFGKYFQGIFYFVEKANHSAPIEQLQQQLAENPQNQSALFSLACFLILNGRIEQSVQALFQLLQIEQANISPEIPKQAKDALMQAFNMLGAFKPEMVKAYRRQLQNLLN